MVSRYQCLFSALVFSLVLSTASAYISGQEFNCQPFSNSQPVEPVLEKVDCPHGPPAGTLCNVTFGYRYCERCSITIPAGPQNSFGALGDNVGQPTKFYPGYTRAAFTLYNVTRQSALYWTIQVNANSTAVTEGVNKVNPDAGKVLADKGVVPEDMRICTRACLAGEKPMAFSTNPLFVPQYVGFPAGVPSTPKTALPDQNIGVVVCNAQRLNGTKFLVLGGCGGENGTHGMASGVAEAAWEDGAEVTVTSRFPVTGFGGAISNHCSYVKPGIEVFPYPVEISRKSDIDRLFQLYTQRKGGAPDNVFVGVGMNFYGPYILASMERVKEFHSIDQFGPEEAIKQAGLRIDSGPGHHIMAITSTAAHFYIGAQGAYSPAKTGLDRTITMLNVERKMAQSSTANQRVPAKFFSVMPGAISTDIGRRDWIAVDRVSQTDYRVVGPNATRSFGFGKSTTIMNVREFGLRVIEGFHTPAEDLDTGLFVYQENPTSTDNAFVRWTLNAVTLPTREQRIAESAAIFTRFFANRTQNYLSDMVNP